MSAYMTGYACPKCGVMQVIVKKTKKSKQTFWESFKLFWSGGGPPTVG
jgi:ssDNA-binding Zn-finger/Zn-ribbon topoisomerase 1